MDTSIIPQKQCKNKAECIHPDAVNGGWLPETAEYFHWRNDNQKYRNDCRECHKMHGRNYNRDNAAVISERTKARRLANIDEWRAKEREGSRKYRAEHLDEIRAYQREYQKTWQKANPEKHQAYKDKGKENRQAYSRQYRKEHEAERREYNKRWYANNTERARAKNQRNQRLRPHINRAAELRYEARKRSLPDNFTATDWQNAINYFNGCCAVCGRQLSDLLNTHTAHADHWIPLSSLECPGTVVTNIVPLCGGEGGCNQRKHRRDPVEFVTTEFGKRRANEILARIENYFTWVREQV